MGAAETEGRHFTSEELRRHNSRSDLWISIQGKVYDVTHWVKDHPGGDLPLLSLAGQDVTDAFVAYHPGAAWAHLDRFLVGRLADYRFSKSGLFERKGHVTLFTLISIFVMFVVAVYGVIGSGSTLVHLLSGGLMGFLWIQSGWIGHDSGITVGNFLAGISIAWWKRNHNAHHIACNSLDFDPDLQHMPFFIVSPKLFNSLKSYFYDRKMDFDAITRLLVSYQHWTFYPVMCFARINLFTQSIILLAQKRVPNRKQEILGVALFWVWYPLLVSCLPNWGERIMFVHIQFCLNHFSSSVYVGHPGGNDWFEKQTMGTLNITCSPWMDWFHGGLQFQVEHHLKISPFVRELCKKHKLSYSTTSFWGANVRTIATLRAAALQARDLGNPVPRNLVWEAVNTHG
ncbi:unnamed protein product [Spirodela intermedia]|uniref:Cytochrome b5 heme-binding domain-containing protein n=1 Tax=Spirodela intermedia TaxID=51605 RepID=A0A7I8J731_SPIIN|nr:unnamed protein product [Spirodela intermedia]CAA6665931.1 unnamed protein product [Spirodela intermedia]